MRAVTLGSAVIVAAVLAALAVALLTSTSTRAPGARSSPSTRADAATAASATQDAAMAWGFNGAAELGNGGDDGESDAPVRVSGLRGVRALSVGGEHGVAVLDDGDVVAWGDNEDFQLGDGRTQAQSALPVAVSGLGGGQARTVSAGGDHSLALLDDGRVMAWGDNEDGQLGNGEAGRGSREGLSDERQGPFGTSMRFVTSDSWSGKVNGREYRVYAGAAVRPASGVAMRSELVVFDGPSPSGYDGSFAPPGGGRKPLRIVSAYGNVLNVSTSAGKLLSFDVARQAFVRHREYGHLSDVPVEVKLRTHSVSAVAAGEEFSLALLADGTVLAWGENEDGQLGDGTTTGPRTCGVGRTACSATAVAVRELRDVKAIAAGEHFALALLNNGTVMSWGENEEGELGDGGTAEHSDVPVAVHGLSGVTAIAAGEHDGLALLRDGTVMAWGSDQSGQLGDPSAEQQSDVPVAVRALPGTTAIAAGAGFAVALTRSGRVMAWGEDINGELGDGVRNGEQSDVPVTVRGLSSMTAIAAGGADAVAVGPSGAVIDASVPCLRFCSWHLREPHRAKQIPSLPRRGTISDPPVRPRAAGGQCW
jgi:alpha-tubulin suppressor-like RCC1 family protein